MYYPTNLPHELTPVNYPDGVHRLLVEETSSGYTLPEADAYARRMAARAEAFLHHCRERSRMKDETLVRKALQSLAFSLRHKAHDYCAPSKLSGTSKSPRQKALWRLTRLETDGRIGFGTALDVTEENDGKRVILVVSHEGDVLGEMQSKWTPVIRPLLAFSAQVRLIRVTGHESSFTLGCNVAYTGLGRAVEALNHALGTDVSGDGFGCDGTANAVAPTHARAHRVEVHALPDSGGDNLSGDPDDVHLWRSADGTACASVPHIARHSDTGVSWGGLGAGCSDLAYSVLVHLFDEEIAKRHALALKEDVISTVPRSGGVIRATDVRAWLASQADQR